MGPILRAALIRSAYGPLLSFASTSGCCGAVRRTGLSCILQHFCWLKRQCADKNGHASKILKCTVITVNALKIGVN